jgi:type II secretory pathway component GspD/PulD (secretin)
MRPDKKLINFLFLFCASLSGLSNLTGEEITTTSPSEQIESIHKSAFAAAKPPEKKIDELSIDGYTINYNAVSITEYIRFASKVCNVNFIFQEQDLNFTVTVVSEDPITPDNVMATLVQILRIHNLQMIEQGNNIVIHQNDNVKQLATLVDGRDQEKNAPIVTRIFRVLNVKPESLATIIKPMISATAILESSPETKQLILTDVTANVNKVAMLIEKLDSPHSPLEVGTYETTSNEPSYLIQIAEQIMKPIAQNNPLILVPVGLSNSIYIISIPEVTTQTLSLLKKLDTPAKKAITQERRLKAENIFVYKFKYRSGDEVMGSLSRMADHMAKSGAPDSELVDTIDQASYFAESNSAMFIGSKDSIGKLKEFLAALDSAQGTSFPKKSVYVYSPINLSAEDIVSAVKEIASPEADPELYATLESAKINKMTNTVIFTGEDRSFAEVRSLLLTIDTNTGNKKAFFVYTPVNRSADEIVLALKQMANSLNGTPEQSVLEHAHVNEAANTITFRGEEKIFKRVQELIATVDTPTSKQPTKPKNSFFIYKIKAINAESLESSLRSFAKDLDPSSPDNASLASTIYGLKNLPETNSILFLGPEPILKRLQEVLPSFDTDQGLPNSQFLVYTPKYQRGSMLVASLKENSKQLKLTLSDQGMIRTLDTMKWVPSTDSIIFTGDPASLKKVADLLSQLDIQSSSVKNIYYVYKLQHASDDEIEEDLENIVKNFKSSGLNDSNVVKVIDNIQYVKETNTLILNGDTDSVDEVKELIAKFDYPRASNGKTSFYIYKPVNTSAASLEQQLKDIGRTFKQAGLADPALLSSINTMKYVEATNSLIFTGTPEALAKIQGLVKDIDVPSGPPIHHVGKNVFLLYKIKQASGPQLAASIKAVTEDLTKTKSGDPDFVNALESMRYVRETNSLLFTGPEEALTKVESLVEKLDVGTATGLTPTALTGPTNFYVYKPQSLPGPELELKLNDFTDNLKMTGLSNPDLFIAISSMRWVEKTQSLIFTGTQQALEQVKLLLKEIDIIGNLPLNSSSAEASIQAIDNTSFLVYKLQFHKGDEIQGALRQIAKDLILSNAPVNQNLLNAINSIQWLEVTNSLLCSGDNETLSRLRELIKNLDIPLKQVFIEMLVIQTTMTNALTFGLEWGAKYKYKDKFAGNMGNFSPQTQTSSQTYGSVDPLQIALGKLTSTITPTPAMVPTTPGFDLGIIGEVIRHGGDTFLSIGSLVQALQTDGESTIVMTPKLITQDGRTSSIFQGSNIPFAGSFVSNSSGGGSGSGSGSTVGTTNIEYRDIGISLTITPVLGNSDIVTLDINLDQTSTSSNAASNQISLGTTGLPTAINGIQTSKTTMQTTVHVPDDHFLILSGMVNTSNTKTKSGIPCLGGLPLIGAAFSVDNTTVNNTNVVIFLRPHILNSMDDITRVTKEQERFFREQSGSPQLEHSYNEAMEFIKSANDD